MLAKKQHQQAFGKKCTTCSTEYSRRLQICRNCNTRTLILVAEEEEDTASGKLRSRIEVQNFNTNTSVTTSAEPPKPAAGIPSRHGASKVKVNARDPCFVNPNSYESVITVLQHMGRDAGIRQYTPDGKREWLTVVCDGLPYIIALKLLSDTYTCDTCQVPVYGLEAYKKHMASVHNDVTPQYGKEFEWVHLRIGHGHYEMNMVRSFLALNWEVFMKDVAYVMGFRSPNAQQYARSGGDHHKSWELMTIMLHGTLDELLVPYVRQCMSKKVKPSAADYLRWSKDVKDPRYMYMFEQIFTYTMAIFNLRRGIRINNAELVEVGRYKHAPIFHGRNHLKYQVIEIVEASNAVTAPPAVQEHVKNTISMSTSGDPSRGEDADFQLEKVNQKSKAWTSDGVPTEADWTKVFRNLDVLDEVIN